MVKYSVIMPAYNAERYIGEAVSSVLDQRTENFNFELIIVDDGSNDSTVSILNKLDEQYSNVTVIFQSNQGPYLARTNGLKIAKGEYCVFLDSDDYWSEDTLVTINHYLNDVDIDLIFFRFRKTDSDGRVLAESPKIFETFTTIDNSNKAQLAEIITEGFKLNNLVVSFFKKSLFLNKNVSIPSNVKHGEDLIEVINLINNANKILFINSILYNYRENSDSITNNFDVDYYLDVTIVRETVYNLFLELGVLNPKMKLKLFQQYLSSIHSYILDLYRFKRFSEAKKYSEELNKKPFYKLVLAEVPIRDISIKYRIGYFLLSTKNYWLLKIYVMIYNALLNLK